MSPGDILLAVAVGFLSIGIIAYGLCELRGGDRLFFFVCVLFLSTWTGAVWVSRHGPLAYGLAWLAFMATGFVTTALLATRTDRGRHLCRLVEKRRSLREGQISRALIAALFWLVSVILILAILAAWQAPP